MNFSLDQFNLPAKVREYHPLKSVVYAFNGLRAGFRSETNLALQLLIGVVSISATAWFEQWEFLLFHVLFMALVISLELVNTAFEYLCDLIQPEYSDKVKSIKDIAAGAVLFSALTWLTVIVAEIVLIIQTLS